jgi:hypothetical protein
MKTESTHHARSLLQKFYGNPKPVRQHKRFGRSKIADSGADPNGAMLEFIKHDIVRPLERLSKATEEAPHCDRWAIGTTKKCASIERIPKMEALKEYNFPDIRNTKQNSKNLESNKTKENLINTVSTLSTDHISILVPIIKKKDESESYLTMKKKFGPHTESYKDSWIPQGNHKTQNNRSSVNYNIINYNNNDVSGAMMSKVLDKKLNNKKKGVAEFMDLTKAFNPNFDKKFAEHHQSNARIFHVYNGVFSHMYDAAHRNGNIVIPFRNNSQANNDLGSHHSANNAGNNHNNNNNNHNINMNMNMNNHSTRNNHHSPKHTNKSKSPKK